MLKKTLGLLSVAGVTSSFAFAGCGSDPAVATDAAVVDAPADTFVAPMDAAKDTSKPEAAPPKCEVDTSLGKVLSAETTPPQKGRGLCTSKQVDDFYAACFSGGDSGTACADFGTANPGCHDCLRGAKAAPAPVIYSVNAKSVQANVVGCGYLVIGKPECANNAVRYIMCYRSVCGDCEKGSAEDTACQKDAKGGVCKQYEATKECADAYEAGKSQYEPICSGTDFKTNYLKVANFMCGSGSDAGTADAAVSTDAAADAATGG